MPDSGQAGQGGGSHQTLSSGAWQCQGQAPALTPLTSSGMALMRPWCPGPDTLLCPGEPGALRDSSCPCPGHVLKGSSGPPPVSAVSLRLPCVLPGALRSSHAHLLGCSGSGLRGLLGHRFLSIRMRSGQCWPQEARPLSWAGEQVPPPWSLQWRSPVLCASPQP